MIAMKTINWSKLNFKDFEEPKDFPKQDSSRNTITKLRRNIVKKLNELGDRWTRLSTYAEPKIWERKDRYGNIYYRIYDPKSDRYIYFNSEEEVRWWLDKRYYL